jgi:hypothetical protein
MPTYLDRYPIKQVVVDGNIPPEVASVRITSGGQRRSRELTVVLARPPTFPINDWSTVQVNVGLTPETAYTRFWGYQLRPQSDIGDRHLTFTAYDPYVKVEQGQLWTTDDPHLSAIPIPQGINITNPFEENLTNFTDQEAIAWGLDYFGLVAPTWRDATLPGTGRILGNNSNFQFFWGEDRPLGEVVAQLEEICLGYKTRGTREGRIERVLLPTGPAEVPDLTLTEGVDLVSFVPARAPLYRYNRFKVTGYNVGREAGLFMVVATYPGVAVAPGIDFRTMSYSNPMLEAPTDADLPAGEGISCQAYADYLDSVYNRSMESATAVTYRADIIEEGMTVLVDARSRLKGHYCSYVVDEVTLDASDKLLQTLTLKYGNLIDSSTIYLPFGAVDAPTGAPVPDPTPPGFFVIDGTGDDPVVDSPAGDPVVAGS